MDPKPKLEPTPPIPFWGALIAHKLPGRSEEKKKNTELDKYHLPMQARNKLRPITVGVNVLIHWSNVVAIQFGVPRSGPGIMRFPCTC